MSYQQNPTTLPSATVSQIRDILTDFLAQCDIIYPRNLYPDQAFRAACYADAARRGFDIQLLKEHLELGITMGDTGYRHLKSYSARIFVSFWTAVLVHIDDYYEVYSDGLAVFFDRLIGRQPQCYKALDYFASLLQELPNYWGAIASHMISTSGIDFLTSTMIDTAIKDMKIQTSTAPGFPLFMRTMNGIANAYVTMVFPPKLDLKTWIQVVPDLADYLNHINDLLSFFKEELAGETVNFISLSASSHGISKIEALRKLAEETAQAYNRGAELLRPCPEAFEAYRGVTIGFVEFHALSVRYKLDQLNLGL